MASTHAATKHRNGDSFERLSHDRASHSQGSCLRATKIAVSVGEALPDAIRPCLSGRAHCPASFRFSRWIASFNRVPTAPRADPAHDGGESIGHPRAAGRAASASRVPIRRRQGIAGRHSSAMTRDAISSGVTTSSFACATARTAPTIRRHCREAEVQTLSSTVDAAHACTWLSSMYVATCTRPSRSKTRGDLKRPSQKWPVTPSSRFHIFAHGSLSNRWKSPRLQRSPRARARLPALESSRMISSAVGGASGSMPARRRCRRSCMSASRRSATSRSDQSSTTSGRIARSRWMWFCITANEMTSIAIHSVRNWRRSTIHARRPGSSRRNSRRTQREMQ